MLFSMPVRIWPPIDTIAASLFDCGRRPPVVFVRGCAILRSRFLDMKEFLNNGLWSIWDACVVWPRIFPGNGISRSVIVVCPRAPIASHTKPSIMIHLYASTVEWLRFISNEMIGHWRESAQSAPHSPTHTHMPNNSGNNEREAQNVNENWCDVRHVRCHF